MALPLNRRAFCASLAAAALPRPSWAEATGAAPATLTAQKASVQLAPDGYPATPVGDPPTAEELEFSYQRARSMLDGDDPPRSLLLRKPLAEGAGGSGHEGTDAFGRDVYSDTQHPAFRVIADWALAPTLPTGAPP